MKTKLFHIILLSIVLFIYSCGSESNINSKSIPSNSNISKSDSEKKSDQSQTDNKDKKSMAQQTDDSEKKSDQSLALVDFNPEDYDRKCIIDTIGPQKTFEIYQSNQIQKNQISEIPQCLMSDSDKKSDQSQTDNKDKKSMAQQTDDNDKKSVGRQTQTFIVFNPSQYSRECIVENLDSQKTFEIYESNKIEQSQITQISGCLLSDNPELAEEKCPGHMVDEGGLPMGPQCNVIPTPLPQGVNGANLINVTLPNPSYQKPIEKCQIFKGDQCAELKWEPVADVMAGEFTAIEISLTNPDVLYAGTDSNDMTMYRSKDAGKTWQLVHVTGHNAGVAISPIDSNIVLYTNLEAAVQLTTNGGENWKGVVGNNPETQNYNKPFTAIAFSTDQPNIVYTAALRGSTRGGIWPAEPSDIFKSTDSGKTWEQVGICETCSSVQTIVVMEGDSNYVWVTADGGLQFTKDGGSTWSGNVISYLDERAQEPQNIKEHKPPKVIGLAIQPGNSHIMLAASSEYGMFRSTDGGVTWMQSNSGLSTSKLHRVNFAKSNPQVVYLTTHDGVFRSDDAGKTWTERSQGLILKFVSPVAIHPANENIVYVGTSNEIYTIHPNHKNRGLLPGGGLYKTVDGGKNWVRSDSGVYEAKIAQIGTHPIIPYNIWVGGESGRGNFFSPDGGSSWLFSASITAHYPMVYAFNYDFPSILYTTGWLRTGELTASTDGGASFYTLTHKLDEGLSTETRKLGLRLDGSTDFHIHGLAVAPSDSNIIYVGSVHDTVYPNLTFNLDGAHIWKSSDGGETFPEMSNGFPIETKTSINAILVHPKDPNIAYAMTTLHETETAIGIYKTTDGAQNWFPVNNGLDVFTNDLQMDPINPEILYAATESGIYKSIDGAKNWKKSSTGIPKGPVIDMAIDPLNPLVLYSITADNIYRTQDGADHWYATSFGIPLLESSSKPLSAQERLLGHLRLDRTKTGHSEYGGTFAQDRTLEIDATGRVIVVAVKTKRNDRNRNAERILYHAVLTPLITTTYQYKINNSNIDITSQSNIYDMVFDTNNNELKFIAAGPTNTKSKTTFIIPSNLMTGEHQVFINGAKIPSSSENNQVTFEHIHIGNNQVIIKTN